MAQGGPNKHYEVALSFSPLTALEKVLFLCLVTSLKSYGSFCPDATQARGLPCVGDAPGNKLLFSLLDLSFVQPQPNSLGA